MKHKHEVIDADLARIDAIAASLRPGEIRGINVSDVLTVAQALAEREDKRALSDSGSPIGSIGR